MEYTEDNVRTWLENHVHQSFYPGHDEFSVLLEVVQRHPNYNNWKNKNITGIRITRSIQKKSLQVEIRIMGVKTQKWRLVSWKACVSGRKTEYSDLAKLNSAMRYAIRRQITIYRNNNPIKKCAICKVGTKIEVDHDVNHKSFKVIRDEFLNTHPEVPTEFIYAKYNFRFKKTDQNFKQKWQGYHNRHAKYRYLCENCNKIYK
jgi:hypothetical protein